MRLFEAGLLAALSTRPIATIILGYHSWFIPSNQLFIVTAITSVQLAYEGYRWQLSPAYFASILQLIPTDNLSWGWNLALSVAQLSLVALSTALCVLLPVFQLRKPSGPFKVGHFSTEISDSSRPAWDLYSQKIVPGPRRLPVRLWYPIDKEVASNKSLCTSTQYLPHHRIRGGFFSRELGMPSFVVGHFDHIKSHSKSSTTKHPLPLSEQAERYPVVFFSHGYCSSSDFSAVLAENIASFGVIVVAIEHTFDSAVTYFESSNELLHFNAAPPRNLPSEEAFWEFRRKHLRIRSDDILFATKVMLDFESGKPSSALADLSNLFKGRIDSKRFMTIGHSFGGATAINVCSEKPDLFKGALGLDAWVTVLHDNIKKDGIKSPVFFIQALDFYDNSFWSKSNKEVCESIASNSPNSRLYYIKDATHQDFLDIPLFAPLFSKMIRITGPHGYLMQDVICRYSVEFLKQIGFIIIEPLIDISPSNEIIPVSLGLQT